MADTTRPVIQGWHGVVASGHYLASQIALRVLGEGGNAVDAGVAAVLALTLLKPQSAGIAGECPILIWRPPAAGGAPDATAGDLPNPLAVNGQGTAPAAATIAWFQEHGYAMIPGDGLLAATVPATPGACITALRVGGRLGLREVLGPVVELARDGFAVYPALRRQVAAHLERYRDEWPSTAAVYLDRGRVPDVGWRLRCRDWADAMQSLIDAETAARSSGADRETGLAAGLRAFQEGTVAERIAAFASTTAVRDATGRRHRGLLSAQDLAGYETRVEVPRTVRYRGLDVHKCGPWTQGPVFLQQLRLLEGFDLAAMGHGGVDHLHTFVESAKLAFADREAFYGDPTFVDVPLERLLSTAYADERRSLIDPARASERLRPGPGGRIPWPPAPVPSPLTAGDTTHVDVIDADGTMFSATPSGGWLESSPVVPGLGFPLGTRAQVFNLQPGHPNALAPGKRPRTTLTPSLVTKDGRPHMVFGTPGGDQQDQWTLQFLLNVVDFGMDLQEAIDAPTVHTQHIPGSFYPHEAFPRRVVVERRVPAEVRESLAARGHDVVVTGDWANGEVCAVRIDPDTGRIEGAASSRGMAAYAMGR